MFLIFLPLVFLQFTFIKRRTGSFDSVIIEEDEPFQILPPIMADIVKSIRKLIEEINSGYATSEEYVESAHSIGNLGGQLLSQIEASG